MTNTTITEAPTYFRGVTVYWTGDDGSTAADTTEALALIERTLRGVYQAWKGGVPRGVNIRSEAAAMLRELATYRTPWEEENGLVTITPIFR